MSTGSGISPWSSLLDDDGPDCGAESDDKDEAAFAGAYAGKDKPNCVASLGITRTLPSFGTTRNVAPVSSMTIPTMPTKDGLREESTVRIIPVKSALRSFDAIPSEEHPGVRGGRGDGRGVGIGCKERIEIR